MSELRAAPQAFREAALKKAQQPVAASESPAASAAEPSAPESAELLGSVEGNVEREPVVDLRIRLCLRRSPRQLRWKW